MIFLIWWKKTVSSNDVAVVSAKGSDYGIHFCFMSKVMQLIC